MTGNAAVALSFAKVPTGIAGFDFIADGGLPKGRMTLIAGTAGSAKTVFALQFLAEGVRKGEHCVFVTFEEPADAIRNNVRSLGWEIARWEAEGKWATVDVSPDPLGTIVTGSYDLAPLLARIENAVRRVNATRVSLDAPGTIFDRLPDSAAVRRDLFRIGTALKEIGVTSIISAERPSETGEISRYGVEEFVADNVILMRNALDDGRRRRTIEILKFRGTTHQKGEYPFTVVAGRGIIVIPLTAVELKQPSTDVRIPSGNGDLDRLCGGGFFRDSIVLIAGAPGCGKTLMSSEFAGAAATDERRLFVSFEESRAQVFRNAASWGIDLDGLEQNGSLQMHCVYPEAAAIEDHLITLRGIIDEFKPDRIAIDTLSALERVATTKSYREFIIGLSSLIKERQICGLLAASSATLLGGVSVTEAHVSTIADTIILLRYVERTAAVHRGITVLKMRGSAHDKEIREYTIDASGMHIGQGFRDLSGLLSGSPHHIGLRQSEALRETP